MSTPAAPPSHPLRRHDDYPRPQPTTHADHGMLSLGSLLRVMVIATFFVTFLLQPFLIPTGSMEPTLLIGDCILVDHQHTGDPGLWRWILPYRAPQRGDIVIFHYPTDAKTLLVKRIVGIAGDRIHLHEGKLILNGQPIEEPFTLHRGSSHNTYRDEFPNLQDADPSVEATWWIELRNRMRSGEIAVPPGEFFVMGDNRNVSLDSRYWGFVPQANIVGRPLLVYLSLRQAAMNGLTLPQRFRRLARWNRTMLVPQ